MTSILVDFSSPILARAVRRNLIGFFRWLGRAPQAEFSDEDGLARWRTPVPYSWFNGGLAERPAGPADHRAIGEVVAAFRLREVAEFTFWLAPEVPAAAWATILQAYGFRPTEGPPGMAVDLETLREVALPRLRIVPVTDAALLREWTMTFIAGYEVPPDWEPPLFDLLSGVGLDLPVRHYLSGFP